MSMEEVNERFPLTKYKTWRSTREAEGLPAVGGVTAPPSRAASLKDDAGTIDEETRHSADSNRPATALGIAQQDHANAISVPRPISPDATEGASSQDKQPAAEVAEPSTTNATTANTAEIDRNASVVTIDEEEDDDDPIRTAAPPEMLAAPGDSCAICLDTIEDDDDVRGLTCGHAFHAACVDPWLTSRRACCPLCKADYYIPKPRADGSDDQNPATGRRAGMMRSMPQNPAPVWIGGRAGIAFGRPSMMFAGPRFFLTDDTGARTYNAAPSRQERRRRQQDAFYQDPATERQQQQEGGGSGNGGWRSRLPSVPAVRMPRFGRRNQQADSAAAETGAGATPAELEAGNTTTIR